MKTKVLGLIAAAAVVANVASAAKIVCEGSSTVGPLAKAFAEYYMKNNPNVQITVSESGSGNGAKAIVNGTCDVADMSRPMKDKEFKAAVADGIQPCPHVVALDGIAMVVHNSNPVAGLTLAQIKDIYLGKITNWKQVGGPNKDIVVITRDTNSGTFETFEKLVMNKEKIKSGAETVGSNGQMRSRVETTPAAVGFAGLGFVSGVKAITVNGVAAEPATIQSGEYAIARPLYMYTNGYPKMGTSLYKFINLYLSEEGQEIVEEIGFVPVTQY